MREWLLDRLTPAVVRAKLHAMALALNWRPSLRHHLTDRLPGGERVVFDARFQFETWDGAIAIHAVFAGGSMKVGSGPVDGPHVRVRFKEPSDMRAFFTDGADSLAMLLSNRTALEGNLSYLFKFGFMSAVISRGATPAPPPATPAGSWDRWPLHPAGQRCTDAPGDEVRHLEDPSFAEYTLERFPRIRKLLWRQRTEPPAICTERARLLTEYKLAERRDATVTQPAVVRQAGALRHVLAHRSAIVYDDDLFGGTTTSRRVGVILFPELGGTGIWPELLTLGARALNPYVITPEDVEVLDRQVFPFWMDDNVREWAKARGVHREALELDERFVLYFMWKTQAISHTVANAPAVLARGLAAIAEEARAREQATDDAARRAVYRAMGIAIDGVLDYARRLAAVAASKAAEAQARDPESAARFTGIAESLARVPAQPARTLQEALQAVWIVFLAQHQESMNAGLSLGRLDTWLDPYLQRDLAGITDPDEKRRAIERAIEMTCAFMLKLTDHLPLVPEIGNRLFGGSSSDQVITLGGVKPDGTTAVCDMTWIFLKATEMLRLRDPNMNARYMPGVNSRAYLKRLCEVNLLTGATPSVHHDRCIIDGLVDQGFSLPHARDWSATGCVEPTSCGRHYGHTNSMMFNLVAPLEMALNDGRHPLLGRRVGPETGDPALFESFERVVAAYEEQLGWLIDRSVEANNALGRAHQVLKPTPLLSALMEGPMESGQDVVDGGAVYDSSGTAMIGLTDVVDSLSAIRTLVFDRKLVSMRKLLDALEADFKGHEELFALLTNHTPKFGQDHPLPGEIANRVVEFVYRRYQSHANYRGGRYLPGYWSMSNHVAFGLLSGALPSGRPRGKPFTPGLTPSHRARAELTSQIQAVAALPHRQMPNNVAFNVKVSPAPGEPHADVLARMEAYVATYFELGGMQIQFNVMSTKLLREAMENPEAHRDLIVRISGYNAYFVELNRDIQQELVERHEHALSPEVV